MKAGPIQRYRRLSSEQRRLLSRSVMLLTAASAAVALLPFRRALAWRLLCVLVPGPFPRLFAWWVQQVTAPVAA